MSSMSLSETFEECLAKAQTIEIDWDEDDQIDIPSPAMCADAWDVISDAGLLRKDDVITDAELTAVVLAAIERLYGEQEEED